MFNSISEKFSLKIEELGWRGIPKAIAKSLSHRLKYLPKSLYMKTVLQNQIFAKLFPFKKPNTLIISTPRSGSSWLGKVLSFSDNVAYLREPVTQAIIQKTDLKAILFDPEKNNFYIFERYSNQAFSGIPPLFNAMEKPTDFFPLVRHKKILLIKEVNPFAINFFIKNYAPKIIVLLRHPAGIFESRKRMGWTKSVSCEEFGYQYGQKMSLVLNACKHTYFTVQVYEHIAKNPGEEFKKLYNFIEVKLPQNFDEIIAKYCNHKNKKWQPYNNKRTSKNEANKWKHNLNSDERARIKKGYFKSDLKYYRNSEDW